MANLVTLQNTSLSTSSAIKLLGAEVNYAWSNLTKANPSNSSYASTEVQFAGWENPMISIKFFIPVNDSTYGSSVSGYMDWSLWNEFVKNQYDYTDTSSKTTLAITVADTDVQFYDYSASSTIVGNNNIPVVVKDYTLNFSPSDSKGAYFWTINAKFAVTK